jgi:hypothetical protein
LKKNPSEMLDKHIAEGGLDALPKLDEVQAKK